MVCVFLFCICIYQLLASVLSMCHISGGAAKCQQVFSTCSSDYNPAVSCSTPLLLKYISGSSGLSHEEIGRFTSHN